VIARALAIAVASAACKADEKSAPSPAPAPKPIDARPTPPGPFASWDVPARFAMLQGAWVQSVGGPRVPIAIDRDHVKLTDVTTVTYDIVAIAPCELVLRYKGAIDHNLPAMPFALRRGKPVLANGPLGQVRGKESIVCTYDGVITRDAAGACTKWTFDTAWTSAPARCRDDLLATDDVLHDDLDYPNLAIPARDFDAATALVADASSYEDARRVARALGGKVGDTSTIPGLVVTVAAAPARWKGKRVTVSATYYGADYLESGGMWTHLIPAPDQHVPMIACEPLEPRGVAPYDPVIVTGTIEDEGSLTDCEITARTTR